MIDLSTRSKHTNDILHPFNSKLNHQIKMWKKTQERLTQDGHRLPGGEYFPALMNKISNDLSAENGSQISRLSNLLKATSRFSEVTQTMEEEDFS